MHRLNPLNTKEIAPRGVVLYNLAALVLAVNLFVLEECWTCHVGEWLDIPAQVAHADAIVVLGGSPERLPAAIDLFHEGIAPELWYTGAREDSLDPAGNEARLAYKTTQEMGIPAEAITLLTTVSTWEDAQKIAATAHARGTRSILVVTDWYHGRRSLCAIYHHLQDDTVQVYYQPVETPGFGPDNWWVSTGGSKIVTTELYKTIFYWGYYGLVPWIC